MDERMTEMNARPGSRFRRSVGTLMADGLKCNLLDIEYHHVVLCCVVLVKAHSSGSKYTAVRKLPHMCVFHSSATYYPALLRQLLSWCINADADAHKAASNTYALTQSSCLTLRMVLFCCASRC